MIPRRIHMFWNGPIPVIVKVCVQRIRALHPEWEVQVLSEPTEHIDVPALSVQHRSDWTKCVLCTRRCVAGRHVCVHTASARVGRLRRGQSTGFFRAMVRRHTGELGIRCSGKQRTDGAMEKYFRRGDTTRFSNIQRQRTRLHSPAQCLQPYAILDDARVLPDGRARMGKSPHNSVATGRSSICAILVEFLSRCGGLPNPMLDAPSLIKLRVLRLATSKYD